MTAYSIAISSSPLITIVPSTQETENIQITNSKDNMYQSASFDYFDHVGTKYSAITIGTEVTISIQGVIEFEGFISSFMREYLGSTIKSSISCIGDNFELERFITDEDKTYTSQKTGYIAKDLLQTYTTLDDSNISSTDGVTVASIVFDAQTIGKCFQRLIQLDGFNYLVGSTVV